VIRFRTLASIGWALVPAACASTNASTPTQVDRVIVSSDAGTIRSHEEIPTASTTVKSTPAQVFPALRGAYEELGIKVVVFDSSGVGGRVGNPYFVKTSRLGNTPLSRYLDCGGTITGPAADNYKVTMSVLSVVSASGSGSAVHTRVSARADNAAASGGSLSCLPIGTLEAALHRVLVRRLGE
jgi:hypothetical protein